MKNLLKILISFLIAVSLEADGIFPQLGGQRAGTSSFTFLKIKPNARAYGMAESYIALSRDASIIQYNPAGLTQIDAPSITFSHLDWYIDISYEYLAFSYPFRSWAIGFETGTLHMPAMEITTEYKPYGAGEYFNFSDYFFGLSFSRKMTERFSFGITGRIAFEEYLSFKSNTLLLDLGTFYYTGYKDLRIAVAFLNFGSPSAPDGTYEYVNKDGILEEREYEKFAPPTTFHLGSAITLYENNILNFLISAQLNHPVDNSEYFAFGGEFTFLKTLSLRAGYSTNDDKNPLSLGAGFSAEIWGQSLRIDYAYRDNKYLNPTQQIQISYNF
ncbi:MAG: PorV/PorQ family protein [Candidatus Marinimicrobia bacterium]|nr:PorV/PorQ family protein [Candidatus Neomarinimicrobiota bacterium]MDD5581996.1 PorV/PorQ family protein [Candidatus Neomarinimicrobiota bacterium]